ncbi:MAG: hypothetical protein EP330_09015 [Deltaproteobacteria bacterium]|nr:MAG: hypothetical protein EP330_09015 [Deltaproteobacteria bacterium]
MRLRLDKIASSTANARVKADVVLGGEIPAVPGTVVAVRVLDEKRVYNKLEDVHGRMMTVHKGDVIAGVLGNRQALHGYSGHVPETVKPGDVLHLLNLGGVIGLATSANPQVGPPARVEVLGAVQTFPELGRRVGRPASINPGIVQPADVLGELPPSIWLVGTSMNSGKTRAACSAVREAVRAGFTVGVAKLTGVALKSDVLGMIDHGATHAVTFADAGLPSTCGAEVLAVARGCLNHLAAQGANLLVVELGDGLLGNYGVRDLLAAPDLKASIGALALCANDPVGAFGGKVILEGMGLKADVLTGPATDNSAGTESVGGLGMTAVNAVQESEAFGAALLGALGLRPVPTLKLARTSA